MNVSMKFCFAILLLHGSHRSYRAEGGLFDFICIQKILPPPPGSTKKQNCGNLFASHLKSPHLTSKEPTENFISLAHVLLLELGDAFLVENYLTTYVFYPWFLSAITFYRYMHFGNCDLHFWCFLSWLTHLLPHSARTWILNPSWAPMRARVGSKIIFDPPTRLAYGFVLSMLCGVPTLV